MQGPKFLGQPSPALRRMKYLTPDELVQYIANLKVEKDRITARLAARQKAGATTQHDAVALKLEQRLGELIEQARRFWMAQGGGGGNEAPRATRDGNSRGGDDAPRPAPQKPPLSSRYPGRRG